MANLILKPSTGGILKIQNDDGTVDALTISTSGNLTAAGTLGVTGNTTLSGTANTLGTTTAGTITSGVTFPTGHIIDIKTAVYRGVQSTSTSSYTQIGYGESDVLEVTTAIPKNTSSKFFLLVSIGCVGQSGTSTGTVAFRLTKGGTFISASGNVDDLTSSRVGSSMRHDVSYGDQNHGGGVSFSYLDSPASSTALVYSVQYNTQSSREGTINRSSGYLTGAESYATLTASSLTVFEIAG
jgi:hypothetical protein